MIISTLDLLNTLRLGHDLWIAGYIRTHTTLKARKDDVQKIVSVFTSKGYKVSSDLPNNVDDRLTMQVKLKK